MLVVCVVGEAGAEGNQELLGPGLERQEGNPGVGARLPPPASPEPCQYLLRARAWVFAAVGRPRATAQRSLLCDPGPEPASPGAPQTSQGQEVMFSKDTESLVPSFTLVVQSVVLPL